MNLEEREILTLEATYDTYETWLDDNRMEIMSELVKACEELLIDELEETHVVNVKVKTPVGYMIQVFKIYREDVVSGLEKVMKYCIDEEEYELAHKVKQMQDYIEEDVDDLQLN